MLSISPQVKDPDATPILSPAPLITTAAAEPDSAHSPTHSTPSSTPVQVRLVHSSGGSFRLNFVSSHNQLNSDWLIGSNGGGAYFHSLTSLTCFPELQEPRKLSYAEVCQKPRKDLPPAPAPCPSPSPDPAQSPPAVSQPLRELRVNKADPETSRPAEKVCEGRPPREQYRRSSTVKGAGFKLREQQRRPPPGRSSSPHTGYNNRRIGKEQNIPPRSLK